MRRIISCGAGDGGGAGIGKAIVAGAAAAAGAADGHRAGAEQHGDDHLGLGVGELLAQLGQMAAGQMPGLVREHADDLVRRLRLHDRAVIDEDAAAVGDERVERALVDDHHLDVLLFQTRGAQDRARVFAQQLLGLGVAQDRRPLGLRMRGRDRRQRDRSRRDEGGEGGGLLAQCDLEQHQAVWVKRSCRRLVKHSWSSSS